jgi:hypothetical protein
MSILRYFNKHHGWYDGKRTPFSGAEEAAAVPLLLEAIEGGAAAETGVAAGAAEAGYTGATAYEAGLAGTAVETAEAASPYMVENLYTFGAPEASSQAAQEAARQAAIQNAGNSQLANASTQYGTQYATGPATSDVGSFQSQQELVNQIANARPEQMVPNNPLPPGFESAPVNTPFEPSGAQSFEQIANNPGMYDRAAIPNTPYDPMQASQEGFKYPGDIPASKGISDFLPSQNQLMLGGGLYALNSMMNQDRNRYGVPAAEKYNGPLNNLKYDPRVYKANAPVSNVYRPNYSGYASPRYAAGGITQLPQDKNFTAGGMYPGSQIDKTQYASSPQMPMSMQSTMAGYDPATNPLTGEPTTHMARGGIAQLAEGGDTASHIYKPQYESYGFQPTQMAPSQAPQTALANNNPYPMGAIPTPTRTPMPNVSSLNPLYIPHTPMWQAEQDRIAAEAAAAEAANAAAQPTVYAVDGGGGKAGGLMPRDLKYAAGGIAGLLKGRGDGMSDSIQATIANKQPARLADGEFVVPADVVSHLGNGSTDAGAKHLYKMMDKVRKARTGTKKQGKQIAAGGYLPIK